MEKDKQLISAIMTAVVALGLMTVSTSVRAADDQTMEKCFGVVKAGQNDCDTNDTTCTMKSMIDADPNYWIYVPKGICAKLVGGVTKSTPVTSTTTKSTTTTTTTPNTGVTGMGNSVPNGPGMSGSSTSTTTKATTTTTAPTTAPSTTGMGNSVPNGSSMSGSSTSTTIKSTTTAPTTGSGSTNLGY